MANWVENEVIVKGNSNALREFLARHIRDGRIDFRTVIPEPESPKGLDPKYIANGTAT